MKIKVTYDKDDILKLIHRDLVANGLKHDLSGATYKGSASVTIEVEGTPSEEPPEAPPEVQPKAVPVPPASPTLREVVPAPEPAPIADEPVGDIRSILAQSNKNANDKKPMYDPEKYGGRTMLEGESVEWPGVPEPRSR